MVHAADHLQRDYSRCNRGGRCIYNYPHPETPYTTIDERQRVRYRRGPGDAWIVPYSPPLLLLWDGHINVEAIFTVDVFLYIYKYLFKGSDHATFTLQHDNEQHDAIQDYIQARYVSTCEAAWRIFGFNISHQYPSVCRLSVHEPGRNPIQYPFSTNKPPSESSTLIRYFIRPLDPIFDPILYTDFYEQYIHRPLPKHTAQIPDDCWTESRLIPNVPPMLVKRRSTRVKVARLQSVRPGVGEAFYIRALLFHHPARSFDDLRTIGDVVHDTFQSAAQAAGLFEDANEGRFAMEDAILQYKSPSQLRFLFVMLILEGSPALELWNNFADDLSRDYGGNVDGPISDTAKQLALQRIELLLQERGHTTADFSLPTTPSQSTEIWQELQYFAPQTASLAATVDRDLALMSPDQHRIYNTIEWMISLLRSPREKHLTIISTSNRVLYAP